MEISGRSGVRVNIDLLAFGRSWASRATGRGRFSMNGRLTWTNCFLGLLRDDRLIAKTLKGCPLFSLSVCIVYVSVCRAG